jgi:hypothetical protein
VPIKKKLQETTEQVVKYTKLLTRARSDRAAVRTSLLQQLQKGVLRLLCFIHAASLYLPPWAFLEAGCL